MREYPRPFSSNGLPEGPPALGSEGTLRTSGLEHPQVVPFEQQLLVALTQFLVGRQVILALNLQRLHALLAHLQRLFDGPQCSANRSGGSFGAVGDQGTILSKPEVCVFIWCVQVETCACVRACVRVCVRAPRYEFQSCSNCEVQQAYGPTTTANHVFFVQPCRGAARPSAVAGFLMYNAANTARLLPLNHTTEQQDTH